VDWYLEPRDTAAVPQLRRQIMDYLRRHASAGRDPGDAEIVVSELLGNALEHTVGPAWVSIRWDEAKPVLTVADLGPGFDPATFGRATAAAPVGPPGGTLTATPGGAPGGTLAAAPVGTLADRGRGLFLVTHLAQDLAVAARTGGGSTVSVTLDVTREPVRPPTPPRPAEDPLPLLVEAAPDRVPARESLLRALVVQLMHSVELHHGPEALRSAINQVGVDLGQQVEAEYRAARRLAGTLTPEQLGECLTRFKATIGGEFEVSEVSASRLVLTASRCPFGPGVRRTPGLCRLTAGVFGGVATRNVPGGEVSVQLEERIAVGDPACRIVVWLQPRATVVPAGAQLFLAPRAGPA
jgi:anti-sigma regulatory factor (Ser/Thr protein kinase)/predicted ArsR family transcriptional regulator